MNIKKSFFCVSLLTAAVAASTFQLRAEHEKGMPNAGKSANEIIGTKVMNAQNEDVGKVHDLIVDVDSGQVPYAVIATGGLTDRSKVAVPLSSLRCSPDGKSVMITATKDQLQAASKTPSGAWTTAANADWSKRVDGYYGQPTTRDRFDRDTTRETDASRTYVRDPAAKGGAEALMTQDSAIGQKIADKVDVLQVRVHNGVAHLYGQVENDAARQSLENKIRSVEGVTRVESHLRTKNQ